MFEKAEILDSPSSLPASASPDNTSVTQPASIAAEIKTEHLKSLKRKPFTSMSLCQKRLRKKAKLQKIISLNKNKYNSLSSSSSFSSLSSSSSSFSQICDQPVKKDPPMKLHKFFHSVPFKCPFCFTFKELPTDFIDHLATAHYSDVKLLYERKCSTIIDAMNEKKEIQTNEDEAKSDEAKKEETDSSKTENTLQTNRENNTKALYTSSTLPPRKQQRLLKSPLNDESVNIQSSSGEANSWNSPMTGSINNNQSQSKSDDFFNSYYNKNNLVPGYSHQQNKFIMPSNLAARVDKNEKLLALSQAIRT